MSLMVGNRKEMSRFWGSIFEDHLINNLSATEASPTEKGFGCAVKLLVGHHTATPMAFHCIPPEPQFFKSSNNKRFFPRMQWRKKKIISY
jgi:hypothetical protein